MPIVSLVRRLATAKLMWPRLPPLGVDLCNKGYFNSGRKQVHELQEKIFARESRPVLVERFRFCYPDFDFGRAESLY